MIVCGCIRNSFPLSEFDMTKEHSKSIKGVKKRTNKTNSNIKNTRIQKDTKPKDKQSQKQYKPKVQGGKVRHNNVVVARTNAVAYSNFQQEDNVFLTKEDGSLIDELDSNRIQDTDKIDNTHALSSDNSLAPIKNEQDLLNAYIRQISQFPLLSQAEEERLFDLYIDKKDQKAGQAIVMSHLRLVVKIAMQYRKFGLNMMDVIAEGNVGLLTALQKFDRTKKARFSTYASLWVKAKVQEFILKSWNVVKIGSQAVRKQLLFNFGGVKKMLGIQANTDATERDKKIANYFGLSGAEYNDVVNSIKSRETSLDAPVGDVADGRTTLIDTLQNNDNFVQDIQHDEEERYKQQIFHESLSILNDRQRDIIFARYLNEGNKATLEELSIKYNISKERVRQIEEGAIKKLKQFAEDYQKSHNLK